MDRFAGHRSRQGGAGRWGGKAGLALVVVAALVAAAAGAWADQRDGRLDGLFRELRATQDAHLADALSQQIWHIWRHTENDKATVLMAQGITAMAEHKFAAALDAFDRVVALAPDFAEGWNKRATVHYLMDHYTASILDIQRTLALEPRHFGAVSGLGLVYMAIGDDGAALEAFKKALEINPHLPGAREHVKALKKKLAGRPI